jgi:hypothetical protein
MSLLTVVRDVCAAVGVALPSTVFGGLNTNRTMQEMVALANEMSQRIAYDTRDWSGLKALQEYTGDGVRTEFPLPANFKRMLLTTNVWSSLNSQAPMLFIPDTDDWLRNRLANRTYSGIGEWTLLGDSLVIQPPPGVGITATFAYLDRNCVSLASGGYGDSFLADNDRFRLDERLLKLGMIWQWMANKGSPYAEPMGTYSDALANAMGHDQPAPILINRTPASQWSRNANY